MLQSLDFLRLFPLTRSRSGGRVLGCPCVTLVLPSLLFKLADVEKEKGSIVMLGIVSMVGIVVVGIVGIVGVGSGWKGAQHEVGGQPD